MFDKQIRRLKICVLKGEKSLFVEMVIVFTQLLLFEGMKQTMRNTRSVGGVPVCLKKIQRFLSRHSSPFSTTKPVTFYSTLKFSTIISSDELTD